MKDQLTTTRTRHLQRTRTTKGWWNILIWSIASLIALYLTRSSLTAPAKRVTCYPPLPSTRLEVKDSHDFIAATNAIDRFLSASALNDGVDAISATVFTRDEGIIWGKGYGRLKGNESHTASGGSVTIDTRFRIASISKLFTALTSFRLQQQGVLTLQDDVRRYIPRFDPPRAGWSGTGRKGYPTTLQMLASHTSGLGRDMPNHVEWPESEMDIMIAPVKCASPLYKDTHTCTASEVLEAINTQPLAVVPATIPSYSNTGFNVLGWSNAAAYAKHHMKNISLEDLLHETITGPLGMNATTFVTPPPESKKYGTAVPNDTYHTDVDFGFAFNPSGGMWSTTRDLGTLGTALLRAAAEEGDFLEPTTARSMMHSVVTLYDNVHSVGAPWESKKYTADREQPYMVHTKSGSVVGHTSLFQIIPELGFGAAIVQTGSDGHVKMRADMIRKLVAKVMEEKKLAAAKRLAGRYGSGRNRIEIVLQDYVLRVKDVLVNGQDMLALYSSGMKVKRQRSYPLWNVQNLEFQVALAEKADDMTSGCDAYWYRFDAGLLGDSGYPIDVMYFEEDKVVYPAFNLTLKRKD